MPYFILFESAAGFALFEKKGLDEVANQDQKIQDSIADFQRFASLVKMKAFSPFSSPEDALSNQNDVSEGIVNDFLREFLSSNLSKGATLGVVDNALHATLCETLSKTKVVKDSTVKEICRGIRTHFDSFIKSFTGANYTGEDFMFKSQRGLAHSYSRAKVKFNVHRADNTIIQSISSLDQLDKDVNTFSMRLREWYSWHFPELVKICNDNLIYARYARCIGNRASLTDNSLAKLVEVEHDEERAQLILTASKTSMGYDINEYDLKLIHTFSERVVALAEFRAQISTYLQEKMMTVAPNLTTLIGETVGARLINHAGSLTNLAKYPASTVQILGAEKALFRALKTRSNTPKYGLIFNSSYIGQAKTKDKGRISRYLANKCSIASRIDAFGDIPTTKFGASLAQQVKDRLKFFESGVAPAKNLDVMRAVIASLNEAAETQAVLEAPSSTKKTPKKEDKMEIEESTPSKSKRTPKKKKDKFKK